MANLQDLCYNLQLCTEKMEEEIKININDVHNMVTSNMFSETKISLEKAKDYHYKEIMHFLNEILNNIKLILFHEEKIRFLSNEENFTQDELKRYSYVQRQVNAFSKTSDTNTNTTKREKRRVASEISVESLDAWERYLDKKDQEEEVVVVEKPVPKRNKESIRKKKKFISSTMNGFLEGDVRNRKLDSIQEDSPCGKEQEPRIFDCDKSDKEDIRSHTLPNRLKKSKEENSELNGSSVLGGKSPSCKFKEASQDKTSNSSTKPKIVDVVYKKNPGQLT